MVAVRWRQRMTGDRARPAARPRGREGPAPRRRRATAPLAEAMEDRTLLSILVTPHGGQSMTNVQVVPIYWGWGNTTSAKVNAKLAALETQLNAFFASITADNSWIDGLSEYGAGNGTAKAGVVVNPATDPNAPVPGGTVTNVTVAKMIQYEITNNKPAVPAPTNNTLYIVFTPPGVNAQIVDPNGKVNGDSVKNPLAYHTYNNPALANNPATAFSFAVMPFPDKASNAVSYRVAGTAIKNVVASPYSSAFVNLTIESSHELAEGITDPVIYPVNFNNPPLGQYMGTGWYYQPATNQPVGGSEIGDLTVGQLAVVNGYVVQRYWSNFIALSTYPHSLPLVGGNPKLPGVVNSPLATAKPYPLVFKPNQPGSTPPPRPSPPAPPPLPRPTPPTPPSHNGPPIPGGGSLVQPTVVANPTNPSNLAVASQNGLVLSTDGGASWTSPIAFPGPSGGDSSLVFDKLGDLYWSYLNPNTGGISIVALNPATGAVLAGPYSVDAPASGYTDVQQVLAADYSSGSPTSDNLAIVWTQLGPAGSSKILLSLSANQGKTWLAPVTVAASSGGTPPTYYYGATVTFAPNGSLDVAYHAQPGYSIAPDGGIVPDGLSGETLAAVYAYSGGSLSQQGGTITALAPGQSDITFNDQSGGRTIPGATFLTQGSVIPQILADPNQPGTLYVVTVEDPDIGTSNPPSSEVVIATLTQNADGTWSSSSTTIAPPASASTFQLFPTASIDPAGDIVVSWYTDASGQKNAEGDYLLDVDATYSVDGGQTWATPFALDSQPFDPDAGAADVLPGPPATTGIGNSFGLAIDGATVFVASDANTYSGSTPNGQQVAVTSFLMPGTLYLPANPGNNVITIRQQSSDSGIDVVQLNGVTLFVGSLQGLSGGIVVDHDSDVDSDFGDDENVSTGENDTLILDYSNGDPVPAGGIAFNAADGGTNTIEVNADANYTLSDTALTIGGNAVSGTDTITLENVGIAQLTGGPSNDTFTLDGWSGSTTIAGGTGTNALVVAGGTVTTSSLTVSHVQSLGVAGGTLDVNASFASIPAVQVQGGGTLELDNGVTLTAGVTNAGTLMLGTAASIADATIAGNYTQTSSGTLDVKLGGTSAGQYDQLHVTGNVSLSGTLDVTLVDAFVPTTGDSFPIITYLGTLAGDFTAENFPTLGNGQKFTTSSGGGSYTLSVTT